jgi:peptidyl-prolyl cis-trans isomerase A (cyclophilin A)
MSKLTKRQLLALAAASAASPAFAQTGVPATTAAPPPSSVPAAPTAAAQPAPAATPAPALQPAPEAPKPAENLGKTVKVRLATPLGPVVLALFVEKAPITTANFLRYVDQKRFDGSSFYRRTKPAGYAANDFGVVQGGLHNDPGHKKLAPIKHESTAKTGILHTDTTVSMGRFAPGTATSDFFICVGDQPGYDASAKDPGYAAFARVIEGMDVVRKILAMPVSPTEGEGFMKGTYLRKPIPITSARRVA